MRTSVIRGPKDTFLNIMATLEEADSNVKKIAAEIKTLKASGTAEPATINRLVVGCRKGHAPDKPAFAPCWAAEPRWYLLHRTSEQATVSSLAPLRATTFILKNSAVVQGSLKETRQQGRIVNSSIGFNTSNGRTVVRVLWAKFSCCEVVTAVVLQG